MVVGEMLCSLWRMFGRSFGSEQQINYSWGRVFFHSDHYNFYLPIQFMVLKGSSSTFGIGNNYNCIVLFPMG